MFGMESTISNAFPTDIDMKLTRSLDEALSKEKVLTTDEDLSQRLEVLSMLDDLFKEWIREVGMDKNLPQMAAENVGGLLCTFGSYRLGVYLKDADIDAIIVVPRHINRHDYFSTFYNKLKVNPTITNVRAIQGAFIPIIKMIIQGVEIDMLFARLALKEVHDDIDLQQDELLRNASPKCVRSLNGYRVTETILRLVPNRESFKKTLIVIKLWAKRHRVYSNALGYLGGVSWAILVARVCQLYPNAVPATLVHKFFLIFSKWQWPQPVMIKPSYNMDLGYAVWDPKVNVAELSHVMPIITPVYPQRNSTFNVSHSTLAIIQDEFKTSLDIMGEILTGESSWSKIFQPSKFFTKYKYYMAIAVFANCDEELLEWRGLVEPKLRILHKSLEKIDRVQRFHLNPDQYPLPFEKSQGKPSSVWFVGLEIAKTNGIMVKLDFGSQIQDFYLLVKSKAHDIFKAGMDIQINHLTRKDLKDYVPDELKKEKAIQSTVGSKIIARLTAEVNHSISKSEESHKSPTSRKRSAEDDIDDNNRKRSLWSNEENNLILQSKKFHKCLSLDNELNDRNIINTLLPIKEKNHFTPSANEIKENIKEDSLLSTKVRHAITKMEGSQDSPTSKKRYIEDESGENDRKKLRRLPPTVA